MFFFRLLILMLVFSCSSNRSNQVVYPKWYLEPNSSDEKHFYASGKGAGKDLAIKDGLKEIATQIKTVVSSKFKQESETTNQFKNNVIQSTLELETSNIELNGYKILNLHTTEDFDFLVLLQVEKSSVIKHYENQRNKLSSGIQQKLQTNNIIFLRHSIKLNEELRELETVLAILASLNINVDSDVSELRNYEKQSNEKFNAISFVIRFENVKFQQAANVLKSAIAEQGYKISDLEAPLILSIEGESLEHKQNSLYLVKHKIHIKLHDSIGETYSSNTIEGISSSLLSFEDATLNAGQELKEKLKKIGFKKYVGIE